MKVRENSESLQRKKNKTQINNRFFNNNIGYKKTRLKPRSIYIVKFSTKYKDKKNSYNYKISENLSEFHNWIKIDRINYSNKRQDNSRSCHKSYIK